MEPVLLISSVSLDSTCLHLNVFIFFYTYFEIWIEDWFTLNNIFCYQIGTLIEFNTINNYIILASFKSGFQIKLDVKFFNKIFLAVDAEKCILPLYFTNYFEMIVSSLLCGLMLDIFIAVIVNRGGLPRGTPPWLCVFPTCPECLDCVRPPHQPLSFTLHLLHQRPGHTLSLFLNYTFRFQQ